MNGSSFKSIGRVAIELGVAPDLVRLITREIRVEAELRLNGVEHFSAEQIQRIAAALDERSRHELPREAKSLG